MLIARTALTVLVLVVAGWYGDAAAQTKLKFVLDWQIQGPQAPFIVAKASGAFTAQGLDVTVDRGTGSQKTIEQVATGTYDMGYGDINSMIEYNVKNPQQPLIAVGIVLNSPPFALISLKRYGIQQPKDLKGASIGAPAGDAPDKTHQRRPHRIDQAHQRAGTRTGATADRTRPTTSRTARAVPAGRFA